MLKHVMSCSLVWWRLAERSPSPIHVTTSVELERVLVRITTTTVDPWD